MISINSERNVYVTFDNKKFFYLFGMKVKNHDYSTYLDVGENPKCQIVRHLSCIWDMKLNGKQQFIKHQIGDVKINLLFDIKNLLKKKGDELDHGNHYIIECSNLKGKMDVMKFVWRDFWLRLVNVFRTDRKEEVINFGLAQAGNVRL